MRSSRPLLASLTALAVIAACGDDDLECTPEVEKQAVLDIVYDWYLFPETLPPVASVELAQYDNSAELVWALTANARELDMDRGWSWVTTATAAQSYFQEGTTVGFGIGLLAREGATPEALELYVSQVYPGSTAAAARLQRGDRILRIGETAEALQDVGPILAADLANGTNTLGALLGPAEAGVTRAFEVAPAGIAPVVLTKGTFGLDPVPVVGDGGTRWRIVDRPGKKLGYVALRTFVATADAQLDQAFAAFKAANVKDVVVDLRYNGGGLVSTGQRLANLLGGGLAGSTMMQVTNSTLRASENSVSRFSPPLGAIAPDRIAFITTGASASASELVPNVLEPWREVKLVGAKTYGKPVGQRAFQPRGCEAVLYLVSFKLENAEGDGEFFEGLPDASFEDGELCDAEDDLGRALGDPEEASTKAALDWLETGDCAAPAVAGVAKLRAARTPDAYPEPPAPTLAQRHVRGLF